MPAAPEQIGTLRRIRIVPSTLSDLERARFARELYAVHSRIFAGSTLESFVDHVIDCPAEHTAIEIYRDECDTLIGYCALHRFARVIEGRPITVLRAEAGLLPEFRGLGLAHWFGMTGALREKLRHPLSRVVYFGTLVHPSSYRFFCKYFPTVFPRRGLDMPTAYRALALALADTFDDPAVDAADPLVRDVGWITTETLEHPAFGSKRAVEDTRFFEASNPGYKVGHGLVVLVPVTFNNVGTAVLRRIREMVVGRFAWNRAPL